MRKDQRDQMQRGGRDKRRPINPLSGPSARQVEQARERHEPKDTFTVADVFATLSIVIVTMPGIVLGAMWGAFKWSARCAETYLKTLR